MPGWRVGDLRTRLAERLSVEDEHPLPVFLAMALAGLAEVYRLLYLVDRLPYRLGVKKPIHPRTPVLGLGNLTVGGTGKTPAAIWSARALQRAGWRPCVLAHGYGATAAGPLVVSRGESPVRPLEEAGDEARLIALSCPGVPVVAGRDRVAAAALAEEEFTPGVLIADDAFQHRALGRDIDLVLLDGVRPFGNGRLLPRGWLREPVSALARAHGLLLVGGGGETDGLPGKPIFHAVLRPSSLTGWDEWRRGARQPVKITPGPVAAFCGLAHPEKFFSTLAGLGLNVAKRLILSDHVSPRPEDLDRWLGSVSYPVITTEKDAIKLTPAQCHLFSAAGRELQVLGVEFVPVEAEALLGFITRKLQEDGA